MNHKPITKPTHCWVGRREACGCILALATDMGDKKENASTVAHWIKEGLIPERVTWEKYTKELVNEPGFMGCIHDEPEPPLLALLSEKQ